MSGNSSIPKGAKVKVRGRLVLPRTKKVIHINLKNDAGSVTSRECETGDNGEFEYEIQGLDPGKWQSWAFWDGDENFDPAKSEEESFLIDEKMGRAPIRRNGVAALLGLAILAASLIAAIFFVRMGAFNPAVVSLGGFVLGISLATYGLVGAPVVPSELERNDVWKLALTSAAVAIAAVLAVWALVADDRSSLIILVGAIGGLVHEVAQSKGTVFIPKIRRDGLYLGALSGLLLGAVAGALILTTPMPEDKMEKMGRTTLILMAFFAGLGLKGVSEAAGTKSQKE